ncbi:BZ3500_MvSof-1268-A1-R1_Chr9g10310 [Microbotryum saponariae]|uniref:BZ3500_MvSof-1268-A1-R1_Chr9g10310 protein n=1 Tax=Microbotryum saponariae TaxID=289078 RepID=A0A2X0L4Q6_9BASI|nr:BZ3501_MvSof-1269-A2-R1_Chr9g10060 [Microbotryum saponariae]SCZ99890.1 BZ3500_MvSof-1268-A1-R1_Chr9g10310 [Microbotryum saponariae]
MKEAPTQPSYNVADGKLSVDDVDRLAAMYAKQRTTVSSLKADGHEMVKLPEGNYGHAVLAQDTAQVGVTMLGKIVSIDRSLNRDASRVTQISNGWADPNCSRDKSASKLATPEAVVVEALQRIRDKVSRGMAAASCSIATHSTTASGNSLQHVFFECLPSSWGAPTVACLENDIDADRYHMFYNNAREGSYNGRNVAKSHATPLPVSVARAVKTHI